MCYRLTFTHLTLINRLYISDIALPPFSNLDNMWITCPAHTFQPPSLLVHRADHPKSCLSNLEAVNHQRVYINLLRQSN